MNRISSLNQTEERGAALIFVLFLVILLAVIVGELAYSGSLAIRMANNHKDSLTSRYAAISGFNYGKYLLLNDLEEPEDDSETDTSDLNTDSLTDGWAEDMIQNVGNTTIRLKIEDGESGININKLAEKQNSQLKKLFEEMVKESGGTTEDVKKIIEFIKGKQGNTQRYILFPEALRNVEGVSENFITSDFARNLCCNSSGNINLNTALEPILKLLFVPDSDITEFLEERENIPFKQAPRKPQLKEQYKKLITFKSEYFRITVDVSVSNRNYTTTHVFFVRRDRKKKKIDELYTKEKYTKGAIKTEEEALDGQNPSGLSYQRLP